METNSSSEPTGSETKAGSAKATSGGKRSRKSAGILTDQSTLLRILQQALHDYQAAGGEILTPDVGNVGTAFVLIAVDMDDVGNLKLRSANNDVGNVGDEGEP